MTFPNARDCEHGHLRRKCPICERDEEIARLRDALQTVREMIRGADLDMEQGLGKYLDEVLGTVRKDEKKPEVWSGTGTIFANAQFKDVQVSKIGSMQPEVIYDQAAEIERLKVDAAYGQILSRYIDRLTDPTPDDPLEKIVELMAKEVNETMVRLRNRVDTD